MTRRVNEPALVLPADRAASAEPQTFPGFPGVYEPGEPVALRLLGLTEEEAQERIAESGLPLEFDKAKVADVEEELEESTPVEAEIKPTPTAGDDNESSEE